MVKIQELRQGGHQVLDVFPFFNEFELLELRLNMLGKHVDTFVLVECTQTFSGTTKPLYFDQHRSRFDIWNHKIIHYVTPNPILNMDDLQARLHSVDSSDEDRWIASKTASSRLARGKFHWKQEFFQKESIRKAIPVQQENDIVFFGDVDEIWNPHIEFEWDEDTLFRLDQRVFPYWMNNESNERWTSAIFTAYKNLYLRSLNELRMNSSDLPTVTVPNGGWHFSYQGGPERIRLKLESFGHQEFNKRRIKSRIEKRLAKKRDVLGRNLCFLRNEVHLPPEVIELKKVLPTWFL